MSSIPGEFPRYANVDGISYQRLFAPGHKPVFLRGQTMAAGLQVLPGTVLGRITATGYLKPSIQTAADGSQTPYAICPRFIDTTATGPSGVSAPQPCAVVGHGTFLIGGLVIDPSWGATPDAAWIAIEPYLRAVGLFGSMQVYSV